MSNCVTSICIVSYRAAFYCVFLSDCVCCTVSYLSISNHTVGTGSRNCCNILTQTLQAVWEYLTLDNESSFSFVVLYLLKHSCQNFPEQKLMQRVLGLSIIGEIWEIHSSASNLKPQDFFLYILDAERFSFDYQLLKTGPRFDAVWMNMHWLIGYSFNWSEAQISPCEIR